MKKILLLGSAGFLGTLARYYIQGLAQSHAGSSFPIGTMVVNVSGCFIIGFLSEVFTGRFLVAPQWRIFFTIGFCGAYTTFSTLAFETFQLVDRGELWHAAANVFLSFVLGMVSLWLGLQFARLI